MTQQHCDCGILLALASMGRAEENRGEPSLLRNGAGYGGFNEPLPHNVFRNLYFDSISYTDNRAVRTTAESRPLYASRIPSEH